MANSKFDLAGGAMTGKGVNRHDLVQVVASAVEMHPAGALDSEIWEMAG